MNITTRNAWGARSPATSSGKPATVYQTTWASRTGFVVHYSAANKNQSVRAIQDYHIGLNWSDIGYNFLVRAETGEIYEGRLGTWLAVGAHATNHNTANIGVCVIGTNSDITDKAKASVLWLYNEANRRAGKTLAKRYHSGLSGASTECPGSNLRSWVIAGMPAPTSKIYKLGERTLKKGDKGPDVGELQKSLNIVIKTNLLIDNDFGSLTETAVNTFKKTSNLPVNGIFDDPTFKALNNALTKPKVKIGRLNMSGLFFAKTKNDNTIYVGDGIFSRWITRSSSWHALMDTLRLKGYTDEELQVREFATLEETLTYIGKRIDI